MATACYVRCSTVGQNEASQVAEIERWLKGHDIEKPLWFLDKKTGDNLRRPAFERLQKAVFAGEVQTIVVYKLDRISRSLLDGITTLINWIKADVRVVSVTQQLDFNGISGQLVASVLFAVSEMETQTRKERQAHGIAVAKSKGIYFGRKKGTTKAKPDRAIELREKGLSVPEICTALNISRRTAYTYLGTIDQRIGRAKEKMMAKVEAMSARK